MERTAIPTGVLLACAGIAAVLLVADPDGITGGVVGAVLLVPMAASFVILIGLEMPAYREMARAVKPGRI